MSNQINIACVCIGNKYDPELYVSQLYKGVKRNIHSDFNFVVLTDNPQHPVYQTIPCRTVQAPNWNMQGPRQAWWYKMYLFSEHMGFNGWVLYFDLDVVIFDDIQKMVDTHNNEKQFYICQDFNRYQNPNYAVSNSSVMKWYAPNQYRMYNEYMSDRSANRIRHAGDQNWITDYYNKHPGKQWWPKEWIMSYKWELEKGGLQPRNRGAYNHPDKEYVIPAECSVAVFHGKPDPYDTDFGKKYLEK